MNIRNILGPSRNFFLLALVVALQVSCSMNRCKQVVDPNPKPATVEPTADATENKDRNGPWATPPHNPSMTQMPNQNSSTSKPTNLEPQNESTAASTTGKTKTPTTIAAPPTAAPSDVENGDKNAPTVKIFKYDGSRQCGQGTPQKIDEMAKSLKGIQILSQENKNDGMMRIQMCGAPTGNANIYEIYQKDMKKAFKKGFREWKPES